MSDKIIVANQVHKTFRTGTVEVHALRGVDLEVACGEMVAIMGAFGLWQDDASQLSLRAGRVRRGRGLH